MIECKTWSQQQKCVFFTTPWKDLYLVETQAVHRIGFRQKAESKLNPQVLPNRAQSAAKSHQLNLEKIQSMSGMRIEGSMPDRIRATKEMLGLSSACTLLFLEHNRNTITFCSSGKFQVLFIYDCHELDLLGPMLDAGSNKDLRSSPSAPMGYNWRSGWDSNSRRKIPLE